MRTINDYPERDTYFFNSEIALQEANKCHRVYTDSSVIDGMQICYYAGDEPLENAPYNCIHVPLENVYNYFVRTKNRIPLVINFDNTEFSLNEQVEVQGQFNVIMQAAIKEKEALIKLYMDEIRAFNPDFSEKKLRVFIPACRETTVMQYVAKNIAEAFKEFDCEVKYFIQDNDLQACKDFLPQLVSVHEFKPHIYLSINHFKHHLISDNIFHFTWFQDPMPLLINEEYKHKLGERDYIFSLFEQFDKKLLAKGISKDRIFRQHFCTNPNIFKERPEIQRKEKIIFIGRLYEGHERNLVGQEELKTELKILIRQGVINLDSIHQLSKKYNIDDSYIVEWLLPSIMRLEIVEWVCSQDILPVELYGSGWDKIPHLKKFHKGELEYGEDVAKVYNSAKYSLTGDLNYFYQQRLLEISASGTIPLVYSVNLENQPFEHKDNVLLYSTKEELLNNLTKTPKKDSRQIAQEISFEKMAKKMLDIAKENG